MKDLTLWTPKSLFSDRFERIFDGIFETRFGLDPKVDIEETDESLLVKAELPGLTKEDISVDLKDSVLTISGEKKTEHSHKTRKFHRTEISYGTFQRSFQVPNNIQENNIKAEFKDGILKITLPKVENAEEVKKIAID